MEREPNIGTGTHPGPSPASETTTTTTAAAETTGPRPLVADLGLWGGLLHRSLAYSGTGSSALNTYQLAGSPSVGLTASFYPLSFVMSGALSGLGLYGRFNDEPGITSSNSTGQKISTSSNVWEAGLSYRFPFEGWELDGSAIYGGQSFTLGNSSGGATVPSVTYSYVRPMLGTRIELGELFALSLQASYLAVFNEGDIKANYFPQAKASGFEGLVALALRLGGTWEVRLSGDYRMYSYTLNPATGAAYVASGATDAYLTGWLGVGCRLH
jgi:hypothetical protein